MLELAIATRTDPGRRRRNEDRVSAGRGARLGWALVADGAGGHVGGDEASRLAIARLEQATGAVDRSDDRFSVDTLAAALRDAHHDLQRRQAGAVGTGRMHSTAVALWLDLGNAEAIWAHVGDSRLYRVRQGVVDIVTADDSLVQRMLEAGLLTADEARAHPRKHQLVAALGSEDAVEPCVVGAPMPVEPGDAFLLCTDGWWESLPDASIASSLAAATSVDAWLDAMARQVVACDLPRQDNFSAAAVLVTSA